ncbi:hypothetical protein [Halobellus sp. EA9]|uniref:hypothetical protein n=1 Tax=Halobellus sp. EA9 TaxID=3421647 RepID=UPI003EC08A9F
MSDRDRPARVVVRRPMNDHGTMTVELCETNETRHVCEYATPELERRLGSLPAEAVLPLAMARVGVRSNVWRAVAIPDRGAADAAAVESDRRLRQPP